MGTSDASEEKASGLSMVTGRHVAKGAGAALTIRASDRWAPADEPCASAEDGPESRSGRSATRQRPDRLIGDRNETASPVPLSAEHSTHAERSVRTEEGAMLA